MGKVRAATTAVIDPMIGSTDIARALGVSSEHALQMMRAGTFGPLFDIGTGNVRMRPRVRKSEVERWIAAREVRSA